MDAEEAKQLAQPDPAARQIKAPTFLYWFVVLLVVANVAVYFWQYSAARTASANTASLSTQVTKAKTSVVTLTALNNGTVPQSVKSTLASDQIGLASDKVVFTLPKGWVQSAPSSNSSICTGGTIDAKPIICDDIVTVLPSALVKANQTTHYVYSPFQVDISVFQHTDTTNAKDWLSTDFGEDLPTMGEPQAIDQSSASINGYDGFTFVSRYSDTPYPSTIFYALVHGNYAVVVQSTYMTTINPTGTAGNDVNENYIKYLPDIKALISSVSFKGRG